MDGPAEMRRCLEDVDVPGIRQLWRAAMPKLPQPGNDTEALCALHLARTQADWLAPRKRFYSHRWLLDNGLPSALPDPLKPAAERMYPTTVSSVGISVGTTSWIMKPAVPIIRGAMEDAVQDVYADGKGKDIPLLRSRMAEARTTAVRKLFGR